MRGPLALIEQGLEGSLPVVAIRGEIDMANLPLMREWLASASEGGRRDLAVDLRHVRFMSAGSLHVLCDEQERMAAHRARLTIICDRPAILRTIALCLLDDVLHVVPNPEDLEGPWGAADERRADQSRDWIARYERPSA